LVTVSKARPVFIEPVVKNTPCGVVGVGVGVAVGVGVGVGVAVGAGVGVTDGSAVDVGSRVGVDVGSSDPLGTGVAPPPPHPAASRTASMMLATRTDPPMSVPLPQLAQLPQFAGTNVILADAAVNA
jgi:hypothetical protein